MQGRDHRLKARRTSPSSAKTQYSPRLTEIKFRPAWWCQGAHSQTIYAHLFRPAPKIQYERRRLETPDGDFLDLDFLPGRKDKPLVLVLAGLEGNAWSKYVRSFVGELQKIGWRACALNYRGCSGEPNRRPATYHSGKTEDLDLVVEVLSEMEFPKKILVVGYSIGGNLLLKWLGEAGAKARDKVEKAVAVSVTYDLRRAVQGMDRGFNREIYTRKLLTQLKAKAIQKYLKWPKLFNFWRVWFSSTFGEFDQEVTAPLNGFKSAADYWERSSCEKHLGEIRVPTALIHSADDPFFPDQLFPHDAVRRSEYLELVWTYHGGHLGFVTGQRLGKMVPWLEQTMIDYLRPK